MRLNFDQLHVQPPVPAIRPDSMPSGALSRLSRQRKIEAGQVKPSIHAGVPACPGCPGEKTVNPEGIEVGDDLLTLLEPFRFDLVEADIAAGAPADELDRTNNLAWQFMQKEGMPFAQAITTAAAAVVAYDPAPGEQEYTDVRSLWRELIGNQQPIRQEKP